MKSRKPLLLALAGAALLAGCATGPYYDSYAYDESYYGTRAYPYDYPTYRYYSYGPGYAPGYYYTPPSVSFSLGYSNRRWR